MILYVSNTNDTSFNMAMEYYLFNEIKESVFYLWVNRPSVIIGRFQNAVEEVNMNFTDQNDIVVRRRVSGGGAVYHDEGNLNYSIITNSKDAKISFKEFTYPVIETLKQMGIEAGFTGRNDIEVNGYKICGNAQHLSKERLMHHGCILFDVDLGMLSKSLNVSERKISSKGIKSVRSRVKNIVEFLDKDFSMDEFKTIMIEKMKEYYPDIKTITLTEADKKKINKIKEEKFDTWEWNIGKSPKHNIRNTKKLPTGNYEVTINVEEGHIKAIKFFGDFFGIGKIEEFEKALMGVRFDKKDVEKVLGQFNIMKLFSAEKDDIMTLIIG